MHRPSSSDLKLVSSFLEERPLIAVFVVWIAGMGGSLVVRVLLQGEPIGSALYNGVFAGIGGVIGYLFIR
jgi:hypothetical protein